MYKLLVVDDEQVERDGVCMLVNTFNYPFAISTRNNGKAALEHLETEKVDVICSDIKMPFMDGLTLCEKARVLYPEVKIVLLTAYNDFDFAKKAIRVKVDDYILKPVVIEEFRDIMDQLLTDLDERSRSRKNRKELLSRYRTFEATAKEELLLGLFSEAVMEQEGAQLTEKRMVQRVLDIVEREYATNVTIGEIADRIHFSRGYLSTVFKQETGMSCMQYITILCMHKAQQLLLQSNMKINDIGRAVGYRDISYFGMTFKKTFGMTSARFRNGGEQGNDTD